ncbi:L-aspartate oxidase [Arthrobacter pigmenti]|uniref:L-aspartate oxidase n=1 Tax=Arthrobacter pigmenti TaxID=271432 RepID=A0A846RRJ1_9MICC|nr:L-aspartate oxidase [Arthrobacter pigmenti]
MTRVLVVGSGIAGLYTALELRRRSNVDVTLVAKGALRESNTWYAQGGIAAVLPGAESTDSTGRHVADTLTAGAGHCDEEAVRVLCADSAAHIDRLLTLGTRFDRTDDGALAVGHEAAHSAPRILHIGGDATGAGIADPLVRAVESDPRITILEHTFLADLTTSGGQVTGAVVVRGSGESVPLETDAVVLATGGAGGLFRHSTNPSVATGDGVAAAWRAGAVVADLEFFQFHPTSLDVDGHPLISEAVRGEGAVIRDAAGHRFMGDYHPDGELAPRDVVSRSIALHLARTGESRVFLDATAFSAGFLSRRFPTLTAVTAAAGFDWSRDLLPVVPAAHYWMGGVATDLYGRTSLPGLYAVGEVARTGVHGANRLASNSLLEGLVFGARAANVITGSAGNWPVFDAQEVDLSMGRETARRDDVRQVMSEHVCVLRDESGLRVAAKQLAQWRVGGSSIEDRETANLLLCARLLTHAAALRSESRGAHYRSDFPTAGAAVVGPTMLRSST